ncbi:MAG: SMP-30/gluconolactonase/LRE family protein [Rhodospirillaceae bacterium]|nr:SMP-30/gluconolactonase/LRE family protein [Rhodospirillaceae bacterium]
MSGPARIAARLVAAAVFALALSACRPVAVVSCLSAKAGTPVCEVDNPEDLARFADTPWILFPQGRTGAARAPLALLNVGSKAVQAPHVTYPSEPTPARWGDAACDMAPPLPQYRGIDVRREDDGSYRVAAINGSARQRIELFEGTADAGGVELSWVGCVRVPDLYFLNDVAIGPDGQLFATHMFYRPEGLRQYYLMAKFLAGAQTGFVVSWSGEGGWKRVRNSYASFPNGIAVDRFGHTVYMAATYNSTVSRIEVATGKRKDMILPIRPDNITWTDSGALLLAGNTAVRLIGTLGCAELAKPGCGFPFAVTEVDPELSRRRTLFSQSGGDIPGASVALQAGNALFLGSAFADRITIVTP